jgi:hypothetical protein
VRPKADNSSGFTLIIDSKYMFNIE